MKLRLLYVVLWALILGVALKVIPQQPPVVQVEQKFHVADTHLTFVTRNVEDWEQFQLLMKLNRLSVEIAQAEAKGEHPYSKIKELKKLAKELRN